MIFEKIGCFFVVLGLTRFIMANAINDSLGIFGSVSFSINWGLLLLSQIAVLVSSFKIQKELLIKNLTN